MDHRVLQKLIHVSQKFGSNVSIRVDSLFYTDLRIVNILCPESDGEHGESAVPCRMQVRDDGYIFSSFASRKSQEFLFHGRIYYRPGR